MLEKLTKKTVLFFACIFSISYAQEFSYIPENAQIVFYSQRDRNLCNVAGVNIYSNEIYTMDTLGNQLTRITFDNFFNNHIAVSFDKEKIASVRIIEDSNGDGNLSFSDTKSLWIIDLVNNDQWRIDNGFDAGWGGVDWDPDNEHVYTSVSNHHDNKVDIYKINIFTGEMINITENIDSQLGITHGKFVSDVSISNDGEWIVFGLKKKKSFFP